MGMKTRPPAPGQQASQRAARAASARLRRRAIAKATSEPSEPAIELDSGDVSLVDTSTVRELSNRLAATRRKPVDDSQAQFGDPSLVVKLQRKRRRQELEPPSPRRNEAEVEEEALGLFDMAEQAAEPMPADGSLFGLARPTNANELMPVDDDDIADERAH
jgi:hypothetical protein